MKYLLDTHVVLWFAERSERLSDKVYRVMQDVNAQLYVSITSAWEVAIKLGTHKLAIVGGLPEFYRMIDRNGFITLPIERRYLVRLRELPDFHRDPFDRIMIATAMEEGLTLITADEKIQKYDISILW